MSVYAGRLQSLYESAETPTVFIVDSDAAVRESLEFSIRSAGWRPRSAASAEEFLARPRTLAPCCLLLELRLPGLSGLQLQRLIRDRAEMPIVFMSAEANIPATVEAMKAGAIEFLTKPLTNSSLLQTLVEAFEQSHAALSNIARRSALEERYNSLSGRERQVMQLVAAGRLNKQVGGELGISEITVKAHRGRVMRKMQAKSLVELICMAANLQTSARTRIAQADCTVEPAQRTADLRATSGTRRARFNASAGEAAIV